MGHQELLGSRQKPWISPGHLHCLLPPSWPCRTQAWPSQAIAGASLPPSLLWLSQALPSISPLPDSLELAAKLFPGPGPHLGRPPTCSATGTLAGGTERTQAGEKAVHSPAQALGMQGTGRLSDSAAVGLGSNLGPALYPWGSHSTPASACAGRAES